MLPVDEIDNLQVPRQQPTEQLDRPAFQRFRQQRVVGVAQRGARDGPGLLPGEVVVVDQDPHQLGDRDRRMRVVELHRGVIGEIVERGEFVEMPAHQVLQRGGREEILLPQPQLLSLRRRVVRIEDARDRLALRARRGGADIIAAVERRELDRRDRARRPQPQHVGMAAAPAGDRRVVRHGEHASRPDTRAPARCRHRRRGIPPSRRSRSSRRLRRFNSHGLPCASQSSGNSCCQPSLNALLEQAVLVTDAVAIGRDAERRHAVEIAGGEPPQSAIAERGVKLGLAQLVEIGAKAFQRGARRLDQLQVRQRVEQQAADQEFDREVIDAFFRVPPGFGAACKKILMTRSRSASAVA